MQNDQELHPLNTAYHFTEQEGENGMHFPSTSAYEPVYPPCAKKPLPCYGVEFQPSEVCPENFIIFDQNDHRSQVMFNPAIAHRFNACGYDISSAYMQSYFDPKETVNARDQVSLPQEDSDEIDALLSSEEEEEQEGDSDDKEEISTARTYRSRRSNSPDSCSSSASNFCNGERKRSKVKKMMRVLREIVPGGEQMSSAAVLDEAVNYLKSLKVEAQKLGVRNFKD